MKNGTKVRPIQVAVALVATEAYGWAPASAMWEGRQPTKSVVEDYLWGRGTAAVKARRDLAPHIEAAAAQADVVIAKLTEEFAGETHGYPANLRTVLTAGSLGYRELGLACSAGSAYRRLTEPPPPEKPAPIERSWLGAIDDKVEITGTIRTAMTVEGYAYGSTQRLLVIDAGPTLAKIYTAAGWAYEVEQGEQVTVTATVKKHTTHREQKETVLTRAKRVPPAA